MRPKIIAAAILCFVIALTACTKKENTGTCVCGDSGYPSVGTYDYSGYTMDKCRDKQTQYRLTNPDFYCHLKD